MYSSYRKPNVARNLGSIRLCLSGGAWWWVVGGWGEGIGVLLVQEPGLDQVAPEWWVVGGGWWLVVVGGWG